MSERIHKATLSQSQGREGWSVIFRHPVLLDRATGKPGRRVRRGLGTKMTRWRTTGPELNELLADRCFGNEQPHNGIDPVHPLIVDIFYHDMVPETTDAFSIREAAIRCRRSSIPATGKFCCLARPGAARRRSSASSSARILKPNGSVNVHRTDGLWRYGDSSQRIIPLEDPRELADERRLAAPGRAKQQNLPVAGSDDRGTGSRLHGC